jgi:hypothetical protein
LETPLSPGASFHLKHMPKPNLNALDVKGDENPPGKTQAVSGWVGKIRPRGFIARKTKPLNRDFNTLNR